jgi:hypothetical protein
VPVMKMVLRCLFVALLLGALSTSCAAEGNPPITSNGPNPTEKSVEATSCEGLHVPRNREVNTGIDPEVGLLDFSYYVAALGEDKIVTINYKDDPSCQDNPETRALIEHVLETLEE